MEEEKHNKYYKKWLDYVYSGNYFKVGEYILGFFVKNPVNNPFDKLIGLYRYYQIHIDGKLYYIDLLPKERIEFMYVQNFLYLSINTKDNDFMRDVSNLSTKAERGHLDYQLRLENVPELIKTIRRHRPVTDTKKEMKILIDKIITEKNYELYEPKLSDMIADYTVNTFESDNIPLTYRRSEYDTDYEYSNSEDSDNEDSD
jgi:hypothetical protein